MSTRSVSCPNCQKAIQVPAEAAGKKIRCKACQQVFTVPGDDPPAVAKPAVAKPVAKPATPVVAKPAAAPPPPPPPAPDPNAPIPFADDDDDEDRPGYKPKAYGVTKDPDEDIPRCPFCAVELDPPDARICKNCGYDLEIRRRHRTVKTYALTGGDYFKWWWPAILWATILLFCGGTVGFMFATLPQTEAQWRKDGVMTKEETNKLTGEKEFIIPPVACIVCFLLIVIIMSMGAVPVIYKRIRQPKPVEEEKRK